MDWVKQFLGFIVFALVIALSGGCVTNTYYQPKLPPDITNIEEAKKDLAKLLEKKFEIRYYQGIGNWPDKSTVGDSGKKYPRMGLSTYQFWFDEYFSITKEEGGIIDVFDDRIEFPFFPLYFKEWPENHIITSWRFNKVDYADDNLSPCPNMQLEFEIPSGDWDDLPNKDVQKIADDLYFIQKHIQKYDEEKLAVFKKKAELYRALAIKPPVSEQQREYIVQADALTQRKDYAGAVDRYLKAVDLDPVSYPGAYLNMALLSAQQNRFNSAIDYMKKYLMLVPDAPDARSAQDKIYEWKMMVSKQR